MYIYVPYSEAIKYIDNGDILLFRGSGTISYFLRLAAESPYTHVGLAAKENDHYISCVEMREFVGGREVNLKTQARMHSGRIDVYKPRSPALVYDIKFDPFEVVPISIKYPADKIIECARELTGEQYGWDLIWWLSKRHLPFIRIFTRGKLSEFDDTLVRTGMSSYVCSTLVAHCIRNHWIDLVHMKPDHRMEPGDIANSAILQYAFTIYFDGDEQFQKKD